jgi:hypothetical protein
VLLLAATASLALYLQVLAVAPKLLGAVRSYPGQVFPWAEPLIDWLLFRRQDLLEDAGRAALHTAAAERLAVLLLGLFAAYGLALCAVAGRRSRALEALVFGAGTVFLTILAVGPAMLSADLFSYVMYGRIFALYGGDPYLDLAKQYAGDPYLRLVYWNDIPSFYGPLWTLLSGGLALLGGERIGLTVLLFRSLAIAAALASGALLWVSLRRIAPDRAAQGLVFFLWNPLLVLETGLSGHNDALLVALLLLGIWLHLGGRRAFAAVAMSLSAMVKLTAIPVLGLYLLLVLRQLPTWRERAKYAAASGLGMALAVGCVLAAARAGPAVLGVATLGSGVGRYTNSLQEVLLADLRLALGEEPDAKAAGANGLDRFLTAPRRFTLSGTRPSATALQANAYLRLTCWLAFGAFGLLAARRARDLRGFLVWSAATMLASYWLVSAWFFPWYVIWALALAALVPTSAAAGLTAILSASVFSIYVGFSLMGSDHWWIYIYRSLPAFLLPPLLFFLARPAASFARRLRVGGSQTVPALPRGQKAG